MYNRFAGNRRLHVIGENSWDKIGWISRCVQKWKACDGGGEAYQSPVASRKCQPEHRDFDE
jgi:hypothetical protein